MSDWRVNTVYFTYNFNILSFEESFNHFQREKEIADAHT
jgi:hypothetical protein